MRGDGVAFDAAGDEAAKIGRVVFPQSNPLRSACGDAAVEIGAAVFRNAAEKESVMTGVESGVGSVIFEGRDENGFEKNPARPGAGAAADGTAAL